MDQRKAATLRRKQGHLNAAEMAAALGFNKHTYFYWMQRQLVPRPQVTLSGKRRYYSAQDIDVIREVLGARDV